MSAGHPQTAASMLRFACTTCGKRLKAPPELGGQHIKCPKCGGAVTIPKPHILIDAASEEIYAPGMAPPGEPEPAAKTKPADTAAPKPVPSPGGTIRFACPVCKTVRTA